MARSKKRKAKSPAVAAPQNARAARVDASDPPSSRDPDVAPAPQVQDSSEVTRRRERGARLAIVLGTFAAFVGTLDNHVLAHWDDERFLADADVLHPSLGGLVAFFTEVRFEAYHPLHLLSYWIDVPWVGTDGPIAAMVIHGVNLALWVVALLLGFEVLRRLGLTPLAAAVATLAFGIHPLAAEVVCWASARKDILATGLSLLAVMLHLSVPPDADPLRDRRAWGSRGVFLLAALAKTSVLPLPLVLIAIDLWTARRPWRAALAMQLPMIGVAAPLGLMVIWIWNTHEMIRNVGADVAPFEWQLVPASLFHLLHTSFWPTELAALYPLHRHAPLPLAFGIAAALALGGGLFFAYSERRRPAARLLGVGLSWFGLFALPVINLVPMYFAWQDRYGVLPLFGLAASVGVLVDALRTAQPRETAIRVLVTSVVVLLPLGWLTTFQVETWRDDDHLWGHATRVQPSSYYAWMKLGETRRERGDVEASLRAYAHAIDVGPELRTAHGGFVLALALRDEANEDLAPTQALDLAARFMAMADDASRLRELASDMVRDGYRDSAAYVLGRSLDLDPVSNERIEHAISVQLRQGNVFMARFYLSRLTSRPLLPDVTAFWEAERERAGLVTDEEHEARSRHEAGDGPVVIPLEL